MARSCGIHIDQRRFYLVALDGNARKHRVVARASGEIPFDVDPVDAVSEALRAIAKDQKLDPDVVGLAVDSGMAAFRSLTVPFDDPSKIEEILKFEIESDLPQWDIDDVVVDYLVVDSKPGVESNLLVTAVPKLGLERQLMACERGGLEANEAELDGTALFEAAHAAGCLNEEMAQVLVHVGDSSTTVVVADGGRLVSMRAIRVGAGPHAEPAFDDSPDGDDEEVGQATADELEAAHRERLEKTSKRIRRELGRTVSGIQTENEIEAIYFCGHPLEGLMAEDQLFDVSICALDAVPSEDELEGSGQELTIAYGAALHALGAGVLTPSLRREELTFTGKFERLELPLAVFALLLCTMLGVKLIVTNKQIDWRDEGSIEAPGDMQLWMVYSNNYLLPDPKEGYPGRMKQPPDRVLDYIKSAQRGDEKDQTKFEEFIAIKGAMMDEIGELQKSIGVVTEVTLPQSALQGAMLVMNTLDELGDRVGRFGIRSFSAEYRAGKDRSGREDRVEIRFDIDFFAETDVQASQAYVALMRSLQSETWCTKFEERGSKPFPNGGGLSYDGMRVEVDVAAAIREMEAEAAG